ncbi:hypothetical protein PG995_013772 [Apiospora arundinis]
MWFDRKPSSSPAHWAFASPSHPLANFAQLVAPTPGPLHGPSPHVKPGRRSWFLGNPISQQPSQMWEILRRQMYQNEQRGRGSQVSVHAPPYVKHDLPATPVIAMTAVVQCLYAITASLQLSSTSHALAVLLLWEKETPSGLLLDPSTCDHRAARNVQRGIPLHRS